LKTNANLGKRQKQQRDKLIELLLTLGEAYSLLKVV